jgi:hypothetical protein
MRYVCGECGSDDATVAGCNRCSGAAFDLDTPVGYQQMADYRALCTERDTSKVGVWIPAAYLASLVAVSTLVWLLLPSLYADCSDLAASAILVAVDCAAFGGAYLMYRWRKTRAQRALDQQVRARGERIRDLAKHVWAWIGLGALASAVLAGIPWTDAAVTCVLLALVAGVLELRAGAAATIAAAGGALLVWLATALPGIALASHWPLAHAALVAVGAALLVVAPRAALWPTEDPRISIPAALVVPLVLGGDVLLQALATPGFSFVAPGLSAAAGLVTGAAVRLVVGSPDAATPASRRASSAAR